MKPRIVLSAVNFYQAGPLSVYQDALAELSRSFADRYEIIALVSSKQIFNIPGVLFIEYPKIRSSWLRRIKFEYYDLRKISRELNALLWLSVHDISPSIHASIQAVYCHNPAPFSSLKKRDVIYDWKYSLFVLFYRYLYQMNILRNDYIIVQQEWMRNRFREMYGVQNVIVAHPGIHESTETSRIASPAVFPTNEKFVFFFPAFPRVFKNVEILLEVGEILKHETIEIWLTFSGDESRYARMLVGKAGDTSNIKFLGKLTREQVFERYDAADCLVFPSRLETWGLPISEFKRTGKPMLLSDLPYAHETVGTYGNVHFFDTDNPEELAGLMRSLSHGNLPERAVTAASIAPPFASGWHELFDILLQGGPPSAADESGQ